MRIAALACVLSAALAGVVEAQAQDDSPDELMEEVLSYPPEWLTSRSAKHGMDLTLDGKVWINADHYGDRDDYALAASDLFKAAGRYRQAWVRGYHLRNPDVPYRESKRLIHVDCQTRRWSTELVAYYDGDGRSIDQSGQTAYEAVIPGTYAENWLEMLCE